MHECNNITLHISFKTSWAGAMLYRYGWILFSYIFFFVLQRKKSALMTHYVHLNTYVMIFFDFIWQMNDHAMCRNACCFMATMKIHLNRMHLKALSSGSTNKCIDMKPKCNQCFKFICAPFRFEEHISHWTSKSVSA